jgi:hypothetical protein
MSYGVAQRTARLRYAVAFLGQGDQGKWWSCSYLTANGLAFGAYNFPRTALVAGFHATSAAAKLAHDHRIGRRRCLHLFRLQLSDEMAVHRASTQDGGGLLNDIPLKRDAVLDILEAEAGEIIDAPDGPVQVGKLQEAFTATGINEMAKHYLAAFRNDIQCLPFFSDTKT